MSTEFHGDRPIASNDEDRFGISPIADRIASAVTVQAGIKGIVLGIEGAWGSGKSSLLALALQRLRSTGPHVAVVEFRPWLVGDRDQLLVELFDALANAVADLEHAGGDATRRTTLAAKGASAKLRSYARHLGPAGKLTGLAGSIVPGLAIVGGVLEKLGEVAKEDADGPTLSVRKDELAMALEELDGRIVVAVDDVDRLEPAEVRELLRLVRSVADFPNVAYLLCYDGPTLARSIETSTGVRDGRAFLEKIVQSEVGVPRPESFALRRLFSTELATFAQCGPEVGQRLMQVVDIAGGRCFDTPRTVSRVLDSLRLFWPSLEGSVDLADLVWLRIIAVASPHTYRWVEEYLDALAVVASGRGSVDARERVQVGKRLDEALEADGTNWERMLMELHLAIPRLGYGRGSKEDADERVFAHDNGDRESVAQARRLASPDHSRIYFALGKAPGSVDVADIEALLGAARDSAETATAILHAMAGEANVSGSTKAERMLDQLRYLSPERLSNTDLRNLAWAVAAVAARLGDEHQEDWGQPRAWMLAKNTLGAIRKPAADSWDALIADLFAKSPHLDFLVHVLRDETFDHGVFGDRPRPHDTITTKEEYATMRDALVARFKAMGLAGIIGQRRSASILYAWSQSGLRQEAVETVSAYVGGDDGRLVEVAEALLGRSRDERGRRASLDPAGLACLFDDLPLVLERLMARADVGDARAAHVMQAVSSSLEFHNRTVDGWIAQERERKSAAAAAAAAADADETPPPC